MKSLVTVLFAGMLSVVAAPAFAQCEPSFFYDWAVPLESGCVSFDGPQEQPGSPTLQITNNCETAVTVTPVDCSECDVELALQPQETGGFEINNSVGEDETVRFTIGWASEDGANGTMSGAVSVLEGAVDPCADSSALCSTVRAGEQRNGWLVLLLVGVLAARRRFA